MGEADPIRRHVAIALVACAVLVFEIAVIRLLSVVLWYHFAFLSLSLAMLGLGASGVWYSLWPPRPGSLGTALGVSAVCLPGSAVAILQTRTWIEGLGGGPAVWIAAVALFILAPMLSLGAAVCVLLIEARGEKIGWRYGADLLGATLGALLVVPLMSVVPAPRLIGLSGFLPLAAWLLVSPRRPAGAALIAIALVAGLFADRPFQVRYTKTYDEEKIEPVYERWTPTARITIFDRAIWNRDPDLPYAWGLGDRYPPRRIPQMWIDQDGSAGTPIEPFGDREADLTHLQFDVTSVGYQLVRPARVCIIGAGGGRDIVTALRSGVGQIDAVELHGAIVEALAGPFRDFSGDVYHRPGVRAIVGEGRSFLLRTDQRYDLIQISLVDSWAATAAGAYSLAENFLYTLEAFQLYWRRLSAGGVLSMSRWTGGEHQLESARLALLALETLNREGIAEPSRHLAVVEARGVGTLLLSRRELDGELLARLHQIAQSRGFRQLWPAGREAADFHATRVLLDGPGAYARLGFDLSPPTDARPFFFQTVSLLAEPDRDAIKELGFNEQSVIVLRTLIALLSLLVLTLFFAPLLLARRLERRAGFWRGSGYFAAIGLGFMFVEVPWIQKNILYLGHPSYATAAVLTALLLGAGLGSMAAARVPLAVVRRWSLLLPGAVAGLVGLASPLFEATLGFPLGARIGLFVATTIPVGLVMGFAFPAGMMRFGDWNKPWFWAINGAFSVLASAVSLALAMLVGFTSVMTLGAVSYLLAVGLFRGTLGSWQAPSAPPCRAGRPRRETG